jgi:hypothetical protein|eukprot:COSAG01_NODE_6560_length_3609_cov_2.918234_2_plen_380_part_00
MTPLRRLLVLLAVGTGSCAALALALFATLDERGAGGVSRQRQQQHAAAADTTEGWRAAAWRARTGEEGRGGEQRRELGRGVGLKRKKELVGASVVPAPVRCAHTTDSRDDVADSRGFVCPYALLDGHDCCNGSAAAAQAAALPPDTVRRHTCDQCGVSGCCARYEACVSCCLRPGKASGWFMAAMSRRPHGPQLARAHTGSWGDFGRCSLLCRHSSEATAHENSYSSEQHHCFGSDPPPAGAGMRRASSATAAAATPLIVVVGAVGASCTAACAAAAPLPLRQAGGGGGGGGAALRCDVASLQWINTCAALRHHQPSGEGGGGAPPCGPSCQPADSSYLPGYAPAGRERCLVSTDFDALSCGASHPKGRRLCACRRQQG